MVRCCASPIALSNKSATCNRAHVSGASLTTPVVAKQFSPMNGFDHLPANTYFGPCPNAIGSTTNTDTYAFTLYALPVEQLTGTLTGVKSIETAIKAANPLAMSALRPSPASRRGSAD